MPQNALLGWRFAWPRWGRQSHPDTAVNKKYVDDAITSVGGVVAGRRFVNTDGDTMVGPLDFGDLGKDGKSVSAWRIWTQEKMFGIGEVIGGKVSATPLQIDNGTGKVTMPGGIDAGVF